MLFDLNRYHNKMAPLRFAIKGRDFQLTVVTTKLSDLGFVHALLIPISPINRNVNLFRNQLMVGDIKPNPSTISLQCTLEIPAPDSFFAFFDKSNGRVTRLFTLKTSFFPRFGPLFQRCRVVQRKSVLQPKLLIMQFSSKAMQQHNGTQVHRDPRTLIT